MDKNLLYIMHFCVYLLPNVAPWWYALEHTFLFLRKSRRCICLKPLIVVLMPNNSHLIGTALCVIMYTCGFWNFPLPRSSPAFSSLAGKPGSGLKQPNVVLIMVVANGWPLATQTWASCPCFVVWVFCTLAALVPRREQGVKNCNSSFTDASAIHRI